MSEQEKIELYKRIRENIRKAQRELFERKALLGESIVIADDNGNPIVIPAKATSPAPTSTDPPSPHICENPRKQRITSLSSRGLLRPDNEIIFKYLRRRNIDAGPSGPGRTKARPYRLTPYSANKQTAVQLSELHRLIK